MSRLELIKQPRSIEETNLDQDLLQDLTLKHLYDSGVLDLHQLSEKLALAGNIVEALLVILRKDAKIVIHGATESGVGLRYDLTELGRSEANNAYLRSGYSGPAPITLEHYTRLVESQSVFNCSITRQDLVEAFSDVVINDELLDQLGPAVHSGRAIMIYGHAGTGKTFICRHLAKLVGNFVYVPQAISVGKNVIQYFDPLIHIAVDSEMQEGGYEFESRTDQRLILCERPVAVSGGELTMDMLEMNYDPATRISQAPLQLKANNGMYIIDDLGRQKMEAMQLLNRWIVPMEEHRDYLILETGKHFPVPFNTILVFSTNLHPMELADEAFLRRLGYKIHFTPINHEQFKQIWGDVCQERQATSEEGILDDLFVKFEQTGRVLLPCHPRDLIGLGLDMATFQNDKGNLTRQRIRLAWDTYFIALDES